MTPETKPQTHLPTCFLEDLAQFPSCDWCHLAGFGHHCVPERNGRGELEREQVAGEVPGADQAGHAHRVIDSVVHSIHRLHHRGPGDDTFKALTLKTLINTYSIDPQSHTLKTVTQNPKYTQAKFFQQDIFRITDGGGGGLPPSPKYTKSSYRYSNFLTYWI